MLGATRAAMIASVRSSLLMEQTAGRTTRSRRGFGAPSTQEQHPAAKLRSGNRRGDGRTQPAVLGVTRELPPVAPAVVPVITRPAGRCRRRIAGAVDRGAG